MIGGVTDGPIADAVLARDRRRVRLLTGLTVGVWLFAGAVVLLGLVNFGLTFPRQALLAKQVEEGVLPPAEREQVQREVLVSFQKGTLLIAFSVAVMAVAALCTLGLIHLGRQATLRQIAVSLQAISEQLREIQAARPKPAD